MPIISLEAGLVLRSGARTLEFLRILEGNKVQFEDQRTKAVQTINMSRLFAALHAGQLLPVLGEEIHLADVTAANKPPRLVTDISSLPDADKKGLKRRMAYVRAMRKRRLTRGQRLGVEEAIPAVASALEDAKPPSASTVLGWMRKFELSSMNPATLLSGNRHRRRNRRIHPLMDELIFSKLRSVYLTPARHTLRHTLDQIRLAAEKLHESGKLTPQEATVSLATVSRRLDEFPAYDIDRARLGVNYARSRYRTTVEGTQASRIMQRLECDHTPLNWVIVCDRTGLPLGRPTLTIVVDSLSGYVVGIYVSFYGPGLTSVLNVLKNAIRPKDDMATAAGAKKPWIAFGIGETIVLDNGLEFHSPQFQLAAWELGMDLEYCRVRTPWLKPKVERFFANLDHMTLVKGRVRKPTTNVINIDPKKDAAITFSDFIKGLVKFVVDVYPFELNSRRLVTPFECFKEGLDFLPPPAFPTSYEQLDLIAAMSKTLTVGPGGIELPGLSYSSTALRHLKEQVGSRFKTLVKWNPDDMGFIYLQDPVGKQWMTVPAILSEYACGLSWIQHRLIRKHAREKHVQGGGELQLLRARQELNELWMNPIARRNRGPDTKILARFTGISSDQVLLGADISRPAPTPQKVLAREEIVLGGEEIPDFEAFDMAHH